MINRLIDRSYGIHIPQEFAKKFAEDYGLLEEVKKVLLDGPENDYYWDTWDSVMEHAARHDEEGRTWMLVGHEHLFEISSDHIFEVSV